MEFYEKLGSLKKRYKLNNNVLADIIGMKNGDTFRKAISEERRSLSALEIKELEQYFNELENQNSNNIEVTHLNALTSSIMMVPLVNQYAYGSYLSGYGDPEFVENLPKIPFILDKEYKGEYLCFEMKGDSMEDDTRESLEEGDILLCRNVRKDFWKSKLHIKQWDFVIVHKERGVVAKRIISHNVENGDIVLHSLNEFYNDYTVNLNDVDQIFNIVDVQKKRKRR